MLRKARSANETQHHRPAVPPQRISAVRDDLKINLVTPFLSGEEIPTPDSAAARHIFKLNPAFAHPPAAERSLRPNGELHRLRAYSPAVLRRPRSIPLVSPANRASTRLRLPNVLSTNSSLFLWDFFRDRYRDPVAQPPPLPCSVSCTQSPSPASRNASIISKSGSSTADQLPPSARQTAPPRPVNHSRR